MDLTPLRQDAFTKVRRKYLQSLFTDAALVALSDFLDLLFRYPKGSRGWMFDAMVLTRTPLHYHDVPDSNPARFPTVTCLWLGKASYQGHVTRLYALPDWSPLLRGLAQPRPQGAASGFFGGLRVVGERPRQLEMGAA